ncbi:hypothetical protein KY285_035857 [Solanum tuberosum]|nr:hypothetical protein KY289_036030 [Solanum tuberosum]KAH0639271.1 hypothetical protein KY285_035857 [Solanum tuberosum]
MEPFKDPSELDQYKRKLGFNNALENCSVYARCNALDRLELWENLERIAWMIGGDFNVVLNEDEKMGGLDFTQHEANDFSHCISNCVLCEVKFSRSKYT